MTPAERGELARLRGDLARLSAAVRSLAGPGVSSRNGPVQVRTTQLGFEAELTSDFAAATGYGWRRLKLDPPAGGYATPGVQPSGDKAYSFTEDTTLAPGTIGWCEPSPDGVGYVFIHGASGGSGSGRSAGSSGGGVRCTGTVYSTVRYRYVRAGDQLVEVSQLETLAWDATGCLVATVGDTSSTVIGCAPCPSDEGSKTPVDVFALCDDAPATLNYEITSDDIPCLDGDAGTIAKSGSTWGPSSTNPCGSDNTLAVTCTGDVWTAVYSTTDTVVTLVDQGPDYLLFKLVSDGHGTVPAGTAYISVTIP